MDKGQVVDEGSHDDLLARGGLYADLYRLQFRDGKQVVDDRNFPNRTQLAAPAKASKRSWFTRLFSFGSGA